MNCFFTHQLFAWFVEVIESGVSIVSLLAVLDWSSIAFFELFDFGFGVGGEIVETLSALSTPTDSFGLMLIISNSGLSKRAWSFGPFCLGWCCHFNQFFASHFS